MCLQARFGCKDAQRGKAQLAARQVTGVAGHDGDRVACKTKLDQVIVGLVRQIRAPGVEHFDPAALLQKSIEHGMEWVGHSDFTALQLAMLAKTGSTTWAGPHVCGDFGVASLPKGLIRPDPDEIMLNCFTDLANAPTPIAGWLGLIG